jgi:hypothetical protein
VRILLAVSGGAVLSLATIALSDREWIHASEWDPSVPLHESTYVPVTVWGRPLAFIRDSPVEGTVDSIDPADTLRPGCLALDWVLFTGASAAVSAVFRRARAR